MARLDGDSRELYEGEREAMLRRMAAQRRHNQGQVDLVRNRYDMAMRFGRPEDDFRLSEVRTIERFSTGHRVDYKTRGFFRG
ncbi:MAG: hypothetical protein E6Q76_02135 [Rhizobium sp.]|nr:MAG: hypothetical protein E6Q76_02135 [Rhizobium sp.]